MRTTTRGDDHREIIYYIVYRVVLRNKLISAHDWKKNVQKKKMRNVGLCEPWSIKTKREENNKEFCKVETNTKGNNNNNNIRIVGKSARRRSNSRT